MNLKGIVLVATALVSNIGIINAEQISIPSVSIPLGAISRSYALFGK